MILEALKRAETLLTATQDFIRVNPVKDYEVYYDGTECDASCLKDDCEMAVSDIQLAIKILERAGTK